MIGGPFNPGAQGDCPACYYYRAGPANGVQSVVASSVRPMFSRTDLLFYQIMQSEHLHNSSTIVNLVGGTLMTDEDQICTGQVR